MQLRPHKLGVQAFSFHFTLKYSFLLNLYRTNPKNLSRSVTRKTGFALLLLLVAQILYPLQGGVRMLLIGDSHISGQYGAHLHRFLHQAFPAEWMSVGIGGAGSRHYTMKLKNFCCGYVVRKSTPDEKLLNGKLPLKIEAAGTADQEPILKDYGSRLDSLVKIFQPSVVLIALGNNATNNHDGLIKLLLAAKPDVSLIWIGPFRRLNLESRLEAIRKSLNKFPHVHFVPVHDLAGHDTLSTFHFSGKRAESVALMVSRRITPVLDSLKIFPN